SVSVSFAACGSGGGSAPDHDAMDGMDATPDGTDAEDMVDPDLVGDVAGDQQLDGLTDIALGCERGASESQINENYAIANDVEKHLDALVGLSAMKIGLAEQIQKVP